ncbi:MAG: domain S-box protein [Mucilaginibacter sp.]|nr:domain S-box protein [Mucilaginibacter sp.]
MNEALRPTGIDVIGDIPWGTHFCHFYETEDDLLSALVPYFKAGLENHEYCIWVTSGHTTIEEAKIALMAVVPNLEQYMVEGCIEFLSHKDWYLNNGKFEVDSSIQAILEKLHYALQKDFEGLRLNGDEAWLDRTEWNDFIAYEGALNPVLAGKRLIISCNYRLDKCEAADVLDIAAVHQCAIARRNEKWQILEVPELKKSKAQIQQKNELLELSVAERTQDLVAANRALEDSEKRIRIFVKRLNDVVEEERSRIAREIHDEFGQRLSGLKMALSSLKTDAQMPNEMDAVLDVILNEVDHGVYLLRKIANELHPTILDKLGIFAAIEWLVKEFENKTRIATNIYIDINQPSVNKTLGINIFRICQEALTNIAKHAKATWVNIRVENKKDIIHIQITDNGKGIRSATLHHPLSMGLSNMEERANQIGAKMNIKSSSHTGTMIELIVPINAKKDINSRRSSNY